MGDVAGKEKRRKEKRREEKRREEKRREEKRREEKRREEKRREEKRREEKRREEKREEGWKPAEPFVTVIGRVGERSLTVRSNKERMVITIEVMDRIQGTSS
uniref:Uncharacterized protein n=1 Tax=Vespula pensylvanica TaxID=30213 RepID=A0A834NK54_VESPE|nr:hypothetical protein H0235_013386 [Vespula pensylvanica]